MKRRRISTTELAYPRIVLGYNTVLTPWEKSRVNRFIIRHPEIFEGDSRVFDNVTKTYDSAAS